MYNGLKGGSTHARMLLTERGGYRESKITRQKKKKNVSKKWLS